ncbi:hypothetical protein [Streptomyces triticisoli]|uniref:hypothetical protein n=1 Tax=Streptomyces triticisoli TaxID=2182797 RepID=UPI000DD961AE|nr:hypothetical protein [Streptomyces triticisoli]
MPDVTPRVPALPPRWMPIGDDPELCSAGHWWDAIRVVEITGRRAIELLREDGTVVGPVILDPGGPEPRMYFLVPPGTAVGWEEPGTVPLGQKCHIVVPPAEATEPPGLHWHVFPQGPRSLTQPGRLRKALGQARREQRGPAEAADS